MRGVFEKIGANVSWDENSSTVYINMGRE
ncbi:MAG: hypothetical protein ACOY30_14500 [Bacillota bacterium]